MHPNTVAPSLLFIGSLASFAMIVQQLFWFRTSRWDNQGRRANRRILAVSAVLFTVLLSTLSGILGLLASQAWRVGDYSRATLNTVGEKVVVVAFQFGLTVYSMFVLNIKALVEPIPSPRIGIVTLENVRGLTAAMSFPLVATTVISTVIAALHEDYPVARFPAICWLVIYIPLLGVSILLYLSSQEHPIVARLWLVFAVGQACGVLSATCALVGKGDFQTPTSLFVVFWGTCVTFALHIQSIIPDSQTKSPLLGQEPFTRKRSPGTLVHTPHSSNIGSLRPLPVAITTCTEDFRALQDPFAPPSSPLIETSFPLSEAARKRTLSVLAASTRHSSPADLMLPSVLLRSLEDDTPPSLSPPAPALVRASVSGAFGA